MKKLVKTKKKTVVKIIKDKNGKIINTVYKEPIKSPSTLDKVVDNLKIIRAKPLPIPQQTFYLVMAVKENNGYRFYETIMVTINKEKALVCRDLYNNLWPNGLSRITKDPVTIAYVVYQTMDGNDMNGKFIGGTL